MKANKNILLMTLLCSSGLLISGNSFSAANYQREITMSNYSEGPIAVKMLAYPLGHQIICQKATLESGNSKTFKLTNCSTSEVHVKIFTEFSSKAITICGQDGTMKFERGRTIGYGQGGGIIFGGEGPKGCNMSKTDPPKPPPTPKEYGV